MICLFNALGQSIKWFNELCGKSEEEAPTRTFTCNEQAELSFERPSETPELLPDIIARIFHDLFQEKDSDRIAALGRVNVQCYRIMRELIASKTIEQLCPKLTVMHQPVMNKFILWRQYQKMAPYVENNAGVTLVSIKGLNFCDLVWKSENVNFEIKSADNYIWAGLYDYYTIENYQALIANNIFSKSDTLSYKEQKRFVKELGCKVPNLLELCHLCIVQKKVNDRRLFENVYARTGNYLVGNAMQTGFFINPVNQVQDIKIGIAGAKIFKSKK